MQNILTACLVALLLSHDTLAAAFGLSARLERRRGSRGGQPLVPASPSVIHALTAGANITNTVYSTNWAGAAWDTYPYGTFAAVTGEFTAPTPKFPPHTKEKSASAAAWVGIDGSTCQTAIFQTGIDFTISNKGHITYDAWYEWFPAYAEDFTDFKIHPGDVIVASVKTTSTTSGTATIENKTTGHSVSKTLTSVVPLCQENAEWIVEDYEEGWTQVPFADFGTVDFKHAVATTKWGATIGPKGATIVDLTASNIVLTSVSTKSNEVIVKYKT